MTLSLTRTHGRNQTSWLVAELEKYHFRHPRCRSLRSLGRSKARILWLLSSQQASCLLSANKLMNGLPRVETENQRSISKMQRSSSQIRSIRRRTSPMRSSRAFHSASESLYSCPLRHSFSSSSAQPRTVKTNLRTTRSSCLPISCMLIASCTMTSSTIARHLTRRPSGRWRHQVCSKLTSEV